MWRQGLDESVLVDPKFKEQFEIAHPTARYAALLDEVPQCFVGTEERLVALVELLCSEMSAAFRGTGALQLKPRHFGSPKSCKQMQSCAHARHSIL